MFSAQRPCGGDEAGCADLNLVTEPRGRVYDWRLVNYRPLFVHLHLRRSLGMDPQSPTATSSMRLPPSTTPAHSPMYAFQVRAFVEASEVVDADADTVEDILDGFEDDTEDDLDVQGEQADADDQHPEWEALLQEGVFP